MDSTPIVGGAGPSGKRNNSSTPWFHRLSSPILFLTISLALVGGYLALTIPISVFPNTDFPRVVVGVDNGVMPIDQMLVTITRPIEEAVNSVPGLKKVTSVTSRGSAEVDLFFDWNSDMILTLQRVDAVVARLQADLPPTSKVETHRLTFAVFPIIGYSLTSDTVHAIKRTNLIDSPGLIEHSHQLVLGLISGQVRSPEQIRQIVVKSSPMGIPIRLGDIAKIAPSVAPVYTMVTANGKPAVLLNVDRQPESNTLDVANEVHALIQQLTPTLPPGVHLEPFYDQSTIVHDS